VKRLIILGSTGSIGRSTLAVVRAMQGAFRVCALSCSRNLEVFNAQLREFKPSAQCVADESAASAFPSVEGPTQYRGPLGIVRMIEETEADVVVNGISGAAGLLPSLSALRSGKDLALANKESLVMAGQLLLAEADLRGRTILPVDSEHAALWGILRGLKSSEVMELILTASGGAFRDVPDDMLAKVTFADALNHPTWNMGPKITVDSSSMANKGLEVIEAHRLFKVGVDRIRVLMHPQSYIHSMVRTADGTLHAEVSTPDMRIPIQNALTYPDVRPNGVEWLEMAGKSLTFRAVDLGRYPMLALAYRCLDLSPAHPIVYNAANEIAVSAFMCGALGFSGIGELVEKALSLDWGSSPETVEEVLAVDAAARAKTRELIA
jgi:1-deoxy-D-xylulose-5-phosphate reductoisomerase